MVLFIRKLSDVINSITKKVSVVVIVALTILTTAGVVSRYIFKSPLIWQNEVSVLLFSWMIFLGTSIAFKKREHIRLDFLITSVSGKIAKKLEILIELIVIAFLIIVVGSGFQIARDTWQQMYYTIDISTAWFYLAFPINAVVMIIHLIDSIIERLHEKKEEVIVK